MRIFLLLFISTMLLLPVAADASYLCTPSTANELFGDAMTVIHPNLAGGIGAKAGTFNVLIDCATPSLVYCVSVAADICFDAEYQQAPDVTSQQIIWILNNYYPAVPGMPSELSTDVQRKAAVQLAIWHFSDGIDISTGGNDAEVFAAANAIIAGAQTATVPATPTSIVLTPPFTTPPAPGTLVTVTATILDQNGVPMPNVLVNYTIVHVGGGSLMTDASGQITVSWIEVGYDMVTFSVAYTIPIGLRWTHEGCQDLIQAATVGGTLSAIWGEEQMVDTENSTWGEIKNLYR